MKHKLRVNLNLGENTVDDLICSRYVALQRQTLNMLRHIYLPVMER